MRIEEIIEVLVPRKPDREILWLRAWRFFDSFVKQSLTMFGSKAFLTISRCCVTPK